MIGSSDRGRRSSSTLGKRLVWRLLRSDHDRQRRLRPGTARSGSDPRRPGRPAGSRRRSRSRRSPRGRGRRSSPAPTGRAAGAKISVPRFWSGAVLQVPLVRLRPPVQDLEGPQRVGQHDGADEVGLRRRGGTRRRDHVAGRERDGGGGRPKRSQQERRVHERPKRAHRGASFRASPARAGELLWMWARGAEGFGRRTRLRNQRAPDCSRSRRIRSASAAAFRSSRRPHADRAARKERARAAAGRPLLRPEWTRRRAQEQSSTRVPASARPAGPERTGRAATTLRWPRRRRARRAGKRITGLNSVQRRLAFQRSCRSWASSGSHRGRGW
jgi:hypothetical protein